MTKSNTSKKSKLITLLITALTCAAVLLGALFVAFPKKQIINAKNDFITISKVNRLVDKTMLKKFEDLRTANNLFFDKECTEQVPAGSKYDASKTYYTKTGAAPNQTIELLSYTYKNEAAQTLANTGSVFYDNKNHYFGHVKNYENGDFVMLNNANLEEVKVGTLVEAEEPLTSQPYYIAKDGVYYEINSNIDLATIIQKLIDLGLIYTYSDSTGYVKVSGKYTPGTTYYFVNINYEKRAEQTYNPYVKLESNTDKIMKQFATYRMLFKNKDAQTYYNTENLLIEFAPPSSSISFAISSISLYLNNTKLYTGSNYSVDWKNAYSQQYAYLIDLHNLYELKEGDGANTQKGEHIPYENIQGKLTVTINYAVKSNGVTGDATEDTMEVFLVNEDSYISSLTDIYDKDIYDNTNVNNYEKLATSTLLNYMNSNKETWADYFPTISDGSYEDNDVYEYTVGENGGMYSQYDSLVIGAAGEVEQFKDFFNKISYVGNDRYNYNVYGYSQTLISVDEVINSKLYEISDYYYLKNDKTFVKINNTFKINTTNKKITYGAEPPEDYINNYSYVVGKSALSDLYAAFDYINYFKEDTNTFKYDIYQKSENGYYTKIDLADTFSSYQSGMALKDVFFLDLIDPDIHEPDKNYPDANAYNNNKYIYYSKTDGNGETKYTKYKTDSLDSYFINIPNKAFIIDDKSDTNGLGFIGENAEISGIPLYKKDGNNYIKETATGKPKNIGELYTPTYNNPEDFPTEYYVCILDLAEDGSGSRIHEDREYFHGSLDRKLQSVSNIAGGHANNKAAYFDAFLNNSGEFTFDSNGLNKSDSTILTYNIVRNEFEKIADNNVHSYFVGIDSEDKIHGDYGLFVKSTSTNLNKQNRENSKVTLFTILDGVFTKTNDKLNDIYNNNLYYVYTQISAEGTFNTYKATKNLYTLDSGKYSKVLAVQKDIADLADFNNKKANLYLDAAATIPANGYDSDTTYYLYNPVFESGKYHYSTGEAKYYYCILDNELRNELRKNYYIAEYAYEVINNTNPMQFLFDNGLLYYQKTAAPEEYKPATELTYYTDGAAAGTHIKITNTGSLFTHTHIYIDNAGSKETAIFYIKKADGDYEIINPYTANDVMRKLIDADLLYTDDSGKNKATGLYDSNKTYYIQTATATPYNNYMESNKLYQSNIDGSSNTYFVNKIQLGVEENKALYKFYTSILDNKNLYYLVKNNYLSYEYGDPADLETRILSDAFNAYNIFASINKFNNKLIETNNNTLPILTNVEKTYYQTDTTNTEVNYFNYSNEKIIDYFGKAVTDSDSKTLQFPTYIFDATKYNISYTYSVNNQVLDTVTSTLIENGSKLQLNHSHKNNGDYPQVIDLRDNIAEIKFTDIGTYNFTIKLVTETSENNFAVDSDNTALEDELQYLHNTKLYIYGYQLFYTNYEKTDKYGNTTISEFRNDQNTADISLTVDNIISTMTPVYDNDDPDAPNIDASDLEDLNTEVNKIIKKYGTNVSFYYVYDEDNDGKNVQYIEVPMFKPLNSEIYYKYSDVLKDKIFRVVDAGKKYVEVDYNKEGLEDFANNEYYKMNYTFADASTVLVDKSFTLIADATTFSSKLSENNVYTYDGSRYNLVTGNPTFPAGTYYYSNKTEFVTFSSTNYDVSGYKLYNKSGLQGLGASLKENELDTLWAKDNGNNYNQPTDSYTNGTLYGLQETKSHTLSSFIKEIDTTSYLLGNNSDEFRLSTQALNTGDNAWNISTLSNNATAYKASANIDTNYKVIGTNAAVSTFADVINGVYKPTGSITTNTLENYLIAQNYYYYTNSKLTEWPEQITKLFDSNSWTNEITEKTIDELGYYELNAGNLKNSKLKELTNTSTLAKIYDLESLLTLLNENSITLYIDEGINEFTHENWDVNKANGIYYYNGTEYDDIKNYSLAALSDLIDTDTELYFVNTADNKYDQDNTTLAEIESGFTFIRESNFTEFLTDNELYHLAKITAGDFATIKSNSYLIYNSSFIQATGLPDMYVLTKDTTSTSFTTTAISNILDLNSGSLITNSNSIETLYYNSNKVTTAFYIDSDSKIYVLTNASDDISGKIIYFSSDEIADGSIIATTTDADIDDETIFTKYTDIDTGIETTTDFYTFTLAAGAAISNLWNKNGTKYTPLAKTADCDQRAYGTAPEVDNPFKGLFYYDGSSYKLANNVFDTEKTYYELKFYNTILLKIDDNNYKSTTHTTISNTYYDSGYYCVLNSDEGNVYTSEIDANNLYTYSKIDIYDPHKTYYFAETGEKIDETADYFNDNAQIFNYVYINVTKDNINDLIKNGLIYNNDEPVTDTLSDEDLKNLELSDYKIKTSNAAVDYLTELTDASIPFVQISNYEGQNENYYYYNYLAYLCNFSAGGKLPKALYYTVKNSLEATVSDQNRSTNTFEETKENIKTVLREQVKGTVTNDTFINNIVRTNQAPISTNFFANLKYGENTSNDYIYLYSFVDYYKDSNDLKNKFSDNPTSEVFTNNSTFKNNGYYVVYVLYSFDNYTYYQGKNLITSAEGANKKLGVQVFVFENRKTQPSIVAYDGVTEIKTEDYFNVLIGKFKAYTEDGDKYNLVTDLKADFGDTTYYALNSLSTGSFTNKDITIKFNENPSDFDILPYAKVTLIDKSSENTNTTDHPTIYATKNVLETLQARGITDDGWSLVECPNFEIKLTTDNETYSEYKVEIFYGANWTSSTTRTYTIDKQGIKDPKTFQVAINNTNYSLTDPTLDQSLGNKFTTAYYDINGSLKTDGFTLNWETKESGSKITATYKFIKLQQTNNLQNILVRYNGSNVEFYFDTDNNGEIDGSDEQISQEKLKTLYLTNGYELSDISETLAYTDSEIYLNAKTGETNKTLGYIPVEYENCLWSSETYYQNIGTETNPTYVILTKGDYAAADPKPDNIYKSNINSVLKESGIYIFTLKDSAGNELSYTVFLDNSAPTILFGGINEQASKLLNIEPVYEKISNTAKINEWWNNNETAYIKNGNNYETISKEAYNAAATKPEIFKLVYPETVISEDLITFWAQGKEIPVNISNIENKETYIKITNPANWDFTTTTYYKDGDTFREILDLADYNAKGKPVIYYVAETYIKITNPANWDFTTTTYYKDGNTFREILDLADYNTKGKPVIYYKTNLLSGNEINSFSSADIGLINNGVNDVIRTNVNNVNWSFEHISNTNLNDNSTHAPTVTEISDGYKIYPLDSEHKIDDLFTFEGYHTFTVEYDINKSSLQNTDYLRICDPTFELMLNTDNSKLMIYTVNSKEYSESSFINLKFNKATNRYGVLLRWQDAENSGDDYEIETVSYEFFPFVFDVTNPNYPFSKTSAGKVTIYSSNGTPKGANYTTSILNNTENSPTREGVYVVTREYKDGSVPNDSNDTLTRNYYFYVDRNGIISEFNTDIEDTNHPTLIGEFINILLTASVDLNNPAAKDAILGSDILNDYYTYEENSKKANEESYSKVEQTKDQIDEEKTNNYFIPTNKLPLVAYLLDNKYVQNESLADLIKYLKEVGVDQTLELPSLVELYYSEDKTTYTKITSIEEARDLTNVYVKISETPEAYENVGKISTTSNISGSLLYKYYEDTNNNGIIDDDEKNLPKYAYNTGYTYLDAFNISYKLLKWDATGKVFVEYEAFNSEGKISNAVKEEGIYNLQITDTSGFVEKFGALVKSKNKKPVNINFYFTINTNGPEAQIVNVSNKNNSTTENSLTIKNNNVTTNSKNLKLAWANSKGFMAQINKKVVTIEFSAVNGHYINATYNAENNEVTSFNTNISSLTNLPTPQKNEMFNYIDVSENAKEWQHEVELFKNTKIFDLGDYKSKQINCTLKLTVQFEGNEADFVDNTGKSFFRSTYTVNLDYTPPTEIYNSLKQSDAFINKLITEQGLNFDDYRSFISFDNYSFIINPEAANALTLISSETRAIYYREYNKYAAQDSSGLQSLVENDERFDNEDIETARIRYVEGADPTNFKCANKYSNEFTLAIAANKYYEIIEIDEAGNYRIYSVYTITNTDNKFELSTKFEGYNPTDSSISLNYNDLSNNSLVIPTADKNFKFHSLDLITVNDNDWFNVVITNKTTKQVYNLSYLPKAVKENFVLPAGAEYYGTTNELLTRMTNICQYSDEVNGNSYDIEVFTCYGKGLINLSFRGKRVDFENMFSHDNSSIVFTIDTTKTDNYLKDLTVEKFKNGTGAGTDTFKFEIDTETKLIKLKEQTNHFIVVSELENKIILTISGFDSGDYWFTATDIFGDTYQSQQLIGIEKTNKITIGNEISKTYRTTSETKLKKDGSEEAKAYTYEQIFIYYTGTIKYEYEPKVYSAKFTELSLTYRSGKYEFNELFTANSGTFINGIYSYTTENSNLLINVYDNRGKLAYQYVIIYYAFVDEIKLQSSTGSDLTDLKPITSPSDEFTLTSKFITINFNKNIVDINSIKVSNNDSIYKTEQNNFKDYMYSEDGSFISKINGEKIANTIVQITYTNLNGETITYTANSGDQLTNVGYYTIVITNSVGYKHATYKINLIETVNSYYNVISNNKVIKGFGYTDTKTNIYTNIKDQDILNPENNSEVLYSIIDGQINANNINNFTVYYIQKGHNAIIEVNSDSSKGIFYKELELTTYNGYTVYILASNKLPSSSLPLFFIIAEVDYRDGNTYLADSITYKTDILTDEQKIKKPEDNKIQTEIKTHDNFIELKVKATYGTGDLYSKNYIDVEYYFNNNKIGTLNYLTKGINGFRYEDNFYYITLTEGGNYKFKFTDQTGKISYFGNDNLTEFLTVTLENNILFNINNDTPINNAVFNDEVTLTLLNTEKYNTITVDLIATLNNKNYEYVVDATTNTYTFSSYGVYTITMSYKISETKTITTSYVFTILNKQEATHSYTYLAPNGYEIIKVEKLQGSSYVDVSNHYSQSEVTLTYSTDTTLETHNGAGRYKITVIKHSTTLLPSQTFEYSVWINSATPYVKVSVKDGASTRKDVTITVDIGSIYNELGECVLDIAGKGGQTVKINEELIKSYTDENGEIRKLILTVTESDSYIVKVTTPSGNTLYVHNFTKKNSLNAMAIVLIIFAVAIIGLVIFMFFKMRKKMTVR